MSIGAKIKHLRIEHGWTIRELAKMAGGISASYLSEIERSRAKPSIKVLERIAGALDTSSAEIMGGSNNDLTADELKWLEAYRKDDWRTILEMLLAHSTLKWGNDDEEYDESGFKSREEFEMILEKIIAPTNPTRSHRKKYWTTAMLEEYGNEED